MEKCPGVELGRVWDELPLRQKLDIAKQLAMFTGRLSEARFPFYGSLYYTRDISHDERKPIDDTYCVGPTTSRTWFDDRRGELEIHHGPCKKSALVTSRRCSSVNPRT